MAYGQTASGKTTTMLGKIKPDGLPDMSGIIPDSASEIFRLVDDKRADYKILLTVSVLEIYNNNIRDLLSDKFDNNLEVRWNG